MSLEKNNNSRVITRIAKSNLKGTRLYSLLTMLTIMMAVTFVSTLVLFLFGIQTANERILDDMQHVMFMNLSEEQMQDIAEDPKTEIMVPYKHTSDYQSGDIKFNFIYFESHADHIRTFVPAAGRPPEKPDEVVVDKKLAEVLGLEASPGQTLTLDADGQRQDFTICGYTENDYETAVYSVYVSREFADTSPKMQKIPYTALVRIVDAEEMTPSEFENNVYQMGADYHMNRSDININGKFEESLQKTNARLYAYTLASIIVLAACAIVIYSIFYLSVTGRVQQIGQLQTIGMTQKQVRIMIRREGLMLGSVPIPAGLILGGIIAYALQPDGWSFQTFFITAALLGAGTIAVIQLSVSKPASIAAKFSPIEAAKTTGTAGKDDALPKAHKKLTPFRLARLSRNLSRKKWWLTTISLAFGGILFITGASYLSSWDPEQFSRQGVFKQAEYEISYLYDAHANPQPYGITDLQLTGHLNKELEEKIRSIPHVTRVEKTTAVFCNIEYNGSTIAELVSPVTKDSPKLNTPDIGGKDIYEELIRTDGILVFNAEHLGSIYGVQFHKGDNIKFHWSDGREHVMDSTITAVSSAKPDDKLESSIFMAEETIEKLWPEMNKAKSFIVSIDDYEKHGEQAEKDIRSILNDYSDLSLKTLRETQIDDAAQIQSLNLQIYGVSAFIIVFSILNLVNTLISSISTRRKELAMLESIGMKEKQIRIMLLWESIFLALPNLLITLTAGTAAGYTIVTLFGRIADYMEYTFPVAAVVLYIAGMLIIPMLTAYLCLRTQAKTALTERIKNTD